MKQRLCKKATIGMVFILAFCLMASGVAFAASPQDFPDMPNDWSTVALTNAVNNGLLAGSGGLLLPNNYLTRAEMATIINRAFNAYAQADISAFTDVNPNAWYHREMAMAVQMGSFKGSSATTLNPDNNITRQEAFVVLANALKLQSSPETELDKFADKGNIDSWARGLLATLTGQKYVNGFNGYLNPKSFITRAEFAAVMDNLIKAYYKKADTYTTVATGNLMINVPGVTFKDVTVTGDLIIGDGVGKGTLTLDNVQVQGRLVIRGGEEAIDLINGTTIAGEIVVYDPNGTVHFTCNKDDEVVKNLRALTPVTFADTVTGTGEEPKKEEDKKTSSGGGGGGGGGPSSTYYTITAKSDVGSKISPLSTRVKKGADAAFTISTIENYAIDTVMLDKTNVTADLVAKGTNEWTYTLKDVRGTHTITVTSKLATLDDYQYKVKVSAGDFDFNTNYYNGNELILAALNQELPVIVKNDRFISYLNKANAKLQEKADSFVYDGQKVKNAEELLDIAVKQMDSILIDQIGLTKSSDEYTAWKALQPSEAEITGDYISSLIENYWAMVRATQESGKLEARKAKFANLDMEEIVQAELQKIGYAYTAKDTIDRSMDYDFSIEGQSISGSVTVNVPIEIPVTLGIDPTSYRFTGEVVTTGTLGTKTFTEINDFTHYMAENFLYENPTIKDFIVKYGENVAITGQGEATAYVMEKDNAEAKAQMIEDIVAKVVANVEPQIIAAHPELSDKDITADLTSEIKNKMGDYINDTLTDALNTTRTKTINEKHIVIEVTKGTI